MTITTTTATNTKTTTTRNKFESSSMSSSSSTSTTILLLLLLFLNLLSIPVNASFSVPLEASSEECFSIRTPADESSMVTGSYEVVDDGVEGDYFDMYIINQDTGSTVYRSPKDAVEGTFELKNVDVLTRLQLCFKNSYPRDEPEGDFEVGFSARVAKIPRALDDGVLGPDAERALKLVEKAAEIHKDWETMLDHQAFTRNREAIHHEMSEAILSRLSKWTYIESGLVIGLAVAQVLYWKRFFETRRYL